MRTITRTIPHQSLTDRIKLYPLGDVHVGARACHEDRFRATVQEIKSNPLAFWVGMGDYCDFVNASDPRFAATALADWVQVPDLVDLAAAQRDHFLELIEPITGKCLALLKGNHEDTIHRHYERAIYDEIVALVKGRMTTNTLSSSKGALGLGYCGFLRLRLERAPSSKNKGHYWTTDLFLHHGWGGGRLAGSKALKLERALRYYDADLVLIGHWHTQQTLQSSVIGLNRAGRFRKRDRRGCVTGTWLEGHPENGETYAERAGYGPAPIGCPIIEFNPSTETYRIIT